MVFSSSVFLLLFLPVVFVTNWLIRKDYSNYLLLLASLVFYAWGEPVLVLLMLVSIVMNWSVGLLLSRFSGIRRKIILGGGVTCNLLILGYYKYAGFLARTINAVFAQEVIPVMEIALPIGISFFTFQAISYIVDVYRGETGASSKLVNVALYISFFPQLIAGPIVKYRDINQQIDNRSINWISVSDGFRRFIFGLGKKVLIANVLGLCVDRIYAYHISEIDPGTAWIGALAYSFQIYYDFSGYSDMAIGLAKMFGFTILENFNYPYLASSISDFWRRWHISLGSWFREYVYIPLGGNRKGKGRTILNLIVVFFLTGLWHGADFSFVLWGLYHGFFSIIERIGFRKTLAKAKGFSVIYTLLVVNFGWVLFRSDTTMNGLRYILHMIMPWRYANISIPVWHYLDGKTMVAFLFAMMGAGLLHRFIPEGMQKRWKNSVVEAVFCVCVLILCIAAIASDTYNPFIYFQF